MNEKDSGVSKPINEKDVLALDTVKKYSLWASGAGLIPMPLADWAAISAIQVKMLSDLSKVYDVPFSGSRVSSLIGALAGGFAGTAAGVSLTSLVKALPVVGTVLGGLTVPATAGAMTYAVGKVFTAHFASGGTLLDFEPEKMREHFRAEMKAAPETKPAKAAA
jgi:uncharacterized protein (DUF697 family)